MYQISQFNNSQTILHIADGKWIPTDPANSDYQQYLAWVAEGNTAEEWSPDATI